jgi:hypothetical protein
MSALPYSIEPWQRKLAGLLRALVQMQRVLVVDAAVFDDVKEHLMTKLDYFTLRIMSRQMWIGIKTKKLPFLEVFSVF